MKKSLGKSCKMYNMLASTTRKVCPSTFRKYRPDFVKLWGKIPFRQSCCEVCQNFEFIMNSGAKYLKGVPASIDSCIDSSMCPYTTYFPKMSCAMRNCSECGVDKLKLKLKEINDIVLNDKRKRFLVKQWKKKREKIQETGQYRTFMHWRHDRLSYADLLDGYIKALENMSSHSFLQHGTFTSI